MQSSLVDKKSMLRIVNEWWKIKTVLPASHVSFIYISMEQKPIQVTWIVKNHWKWSSYISVIDDEILFQNWFNIARFTKVRVSIINRLSNRWGPPIIDVEFSGRFPSLIKIYILTEMLLLDKVLNKEIMLMNIWMLL